MRFIGAASRPAGRQPVLFPPAPQVERGDDPEQRPQVPEVQDLVEHRGEEHADHGGAQQLRAGEDVGVLAAATAAWRSGGSGRRR